MATENPNPLFEEQFATTLAMLTETARKEKKGILEMEYAMRCLPGPACWVTDDDGGIANMVVVELGPQGQYLQPVQIGELYEPAFLDQFGSRGFIRKQ